MPIAISFFLCCEHPRLEIPCVLRRYVQKKVYWGPMLFILLDTKYNNYYE